MAKRLQVFEHLGAYATRSPISDLCSLTERVWHTSHELGGGEEQKGQRSRQFLITRMLYIAEVTSSAIRLDASWALTHAAMSLLRDRYEQAVRFSWLVRSGEDEFHKYERAIFAKMNSLVRSLGVETKKHYAELVGELPDWATETPTKEERAYLDAWGTLDLRSMATKRDALPPLAEKTVAKESLAHWYESIYSQFSSVSHYDRYSIEILGLHPAPDGRLVLAAQPHWPGLLILQNCYFDIIQCFEAAHVCHKQNAASTFELFLAEWLSLSKVLLPR
jgi:hypothetical protein